MSVLIDGDHDTAEPCVFCRILAGEVPASIVWRHARAVAFLDLRQPHPGHVLIVPRRHVSRWHELTAEEAGTLGAAAVTLARALIDTVNMRSYSMWQSNGPDAFQEVPHVHLHLSPREADDGLLRVYPGEVPTPAPRETLDALAERLRAALG